MYVLLFLCQQTRQSKANRVSLPTPNSLMTNLNLFLSVILWKLLNGVSFVRHLWLKVCCTCLTEAIWHPSEYLCLCFHFLWWAPDFENMKVITCEIAWHNKEPVYSLDFQHSSDGRINRLATAGVDTTVRVSKQTLGNISRNSRAFLMAQDIFLSFSGHRINWTK